MEYDLRRELPVFERRITDAAAAAILRQPAPMVFVRLLESIERTEHRQQLVVRLLHLALEDVLRVHKHSTLCIHSRHNDGDTMLRMHMQKTLSNVRKEGYADFLM